MNTHSFRIFYCQEWLWGEDQGACSPLTQEEAKKLYDKKMLYAVIIGSFIEKPTYVITLNESNDFFSVNFFDNWGRGYLTHQFQKYPDSERYYLSMAVWREYMSLDSHEMAEGTAYFFNAENDECYVLKEDFTTNQRYEKKEHYSQKDKIILFPEFGKYDDILNPNII